MTIPIFIAIAAVIFLAGVLFVILGLSSEEQEAVPILNPEEIRELKSAFVAAKNTVPESSVGLNEPTSAPPETRNGEAIEENHQLRKDLQGQRLRFEQLERDMELLKREYGQVKTQKEEEVETLKKEKAKFDREQEILSSESQLLNDLKVKTERLETQYEQAQKQQSEMRRLIDQLTIEKDHLLMQTKLREEQVANQIKEQRAQASKVEFDALSNKLSESIAVIEELKRDNKSLKQINEELRAAFAKTEAMNAHLVKKEKMIEYELTKNRAQALGLEKICEDFRTQIEIMAESAAQ